LDVTIDDTDVVNCITVGGGIVNLIIHDVVGSTNAFNVSGGTLNLYYNNLTGARVHTGGTLRVWNPPVAMTNGQLVIGSTGVEPVVANLTAGDGISITNGAGSITISNTGTGSKWNFVSSNQNMTTDNQYMCIAPGGALTLALPATSTKGDEIEVSLNGATSWQITQAAGQQIYIGDSNTTLGVGGSLTSTKQGDSLRAVCVVDNLKWTVLSSFGNITIV
jgi:hypothetical protein